MLHTHSHKFFRPQFSSTNLTDLPAPDHNKVGSYLNVLLQNKGPVQILLDTGSARNCIDYNYVYRLRLPTSNLSPENSSHFRSAHGTIMRTMGMVRVTMQIGNVNMDMEFHVIKDLKVDGLVGRDFIKDFNILIDVPAGHIEMRDFHEKIPLFNWGEVPIMAFCRDAVEIPPNSQKVIPIIIYKQFEGEKVVLLGPMTKCGASNFHVARTLVRPNKIKHCPIRNDTSETIFLSKNAPITLVSIVDDIICVMNNNDNKNDNTANTKKKHTFEELDIEIKNDEITESQKQRFRELINDYGDIFALDNSEIEGTDVMEYEIHMKPGATPKKLAQYHYSEQSRNEIRKQIKELLDIKFISPSTSPWMSNVLLIKKSNQSYRMCVDYRYVNSQMETEVCNVPTFVEIMDTLSYAKPVIFSSLDLRSGFHNLKQAHDSKKYTPLSTFSASSTYY